MHAAQRAPASLTLLYASHRVRVCLSTCGVRLCGRCRASSRARRRAETAAARGVVSPAAASPAATSAKKGSRRSSAAAVVEEAPEVLTMQQAFLPVASLYRVLAVRDRHNPLFLSRNCRCARGLCACLWCPSLLCVGAVIRVRVARCVWRWLRR